MHPLSLHEFWFQLDGISISLTYVQFTETNDQDLDCTISKTTDGNGKKLW